ncbi:MAG: hypothetical protein BRC38_11170 [Cyanobacteria bacterium QH_6_48_35]|nr:MAG: hypothetical protein BRC38_11170 [Cyanobacteria bacterium QH_6_48_35]
MFNHLIFSVLHKLPATLKALQVLLTMVDFAVFHELVGAAARARSQIHRHQLTNENLLFLSLLF